VRVAGLPMVVCAALVSGLLPHARQRKDGGAAVLSLARCNRPAANGCRGSAGGGGGSGGLEEADVKMGGMAWSRRGRMRWKRLAHGRAQRRMRSVCCATRGTNHDAATTMLSVRSRGMDWVCEARGRGSAECRVQSGECRQRQAGWGLLRGAWCLLLRDKSSNRAGQSRLQASHLARILHTALLCRRTGRCRRC
jgi:hypothetical protein